MLALMQLQEFTAPKKDQVKQRTVTNIVYFQSQPKQLQHSTSLHYL